LYSEEVQSWNGVWVTSKRQTLDLLNLVANALYAQMCSFSTSSTFLSPQKFSRGVSLGSLRVLEELDSSENLSPNPAVPTTPLPNDSVFKHKFVFGNEDFCSTRNQVVPSSLSPMDIENEDRNQPNGESMVPLVLSFGTESFVTAPEPNPDDYRLEIIGQEGEIYDHPTLCNACKYGAGTHVCRRHSLTNKGHRRWVEDDSKTGQGHFDSTMGFRKQIVRRHYLYCCWYCCWYCCCVAMEVLLLLVVVVAVVFNFLEN